MQRKKETFRVVQRSALYRSRRELSNAYFLAKFGFDTAENEPSKVSDRVLRDPFRRRPAARLPGRGVLVSFHGVRGSFSDSLPQPE